MFTGIIQYVAAVRDVRPSGASRRLCLDLGPLAKGLEAGASVAVNGVCLTACEVDGSSACFDVIAETLRRTTLGALRPGHRVNLERALLADGRLDGHIVQGHVDGTAGVHTIRRAADWLVEFQAARDLTDLMVPKGSVAIDGVSLTLVDVGEATFSVALIPATLQGTALGDLGVGDAVNIETDILGRYVRKFLGQGKAGGGLTMEKLREAGFM